VTPPRRTVEEVTADIVRLSVAGTRSPQGRSHVAERVRALTAEACEVTAAGYRKSLARAWSAYLDLFLSDRDLVLDIRYGEPELWQRLCDAVLGEARD
jgi:hypothetical protein